jgi:hypothetical protein
MRHSAVSGVTRTIETRPHLDEGQRDNPDQQQHASFMANGHPRGRVPPCAAAYSGDPGPPDMSIRLNVSSTADAEALELGRVRL